MISELIGNGAVSSSQLNLFIFEHIAPKNALTDRKINIIAFKLHCVVIVVLRVESAGFILNGGAFFKNNAANLAGIGENFF